MEGTNFRLTTQEIPYEYLVTIKWELYIKSTGFIFVQKTEIENQYSLRMENSEL